MDVIIRKDVKSAVDLAARIMADALRKRPDMTLGLATGRTMEALYAELVKMHREEGLDFSLAKSFNLDEYVGLAPDNVNSYRYYMNHHLFDHVNIDKRNTHLPNGLAKCEAGECERYEQEMRLAGGIDLQLVGIGRSGDIGFNEPLSPLTSRTRSVALSKGTIEQNSPLFTYPDVMPRRAFTMGVGTVLDARSVLLLATGAEKADIIAKAIEGPVTSMISASALQMHQNCTVILDEEAAAKLQLRDFCDWTFANDPKWDAFR